MLAFVRFGKKMANCLPEYELKRNKRARRVILRMTRELAVVVTAPPRTSRRTIDRFLAERADWLARTEAQLRAQGCMRPQEQLVPHEIFFAAVDERFEVRLAPGDDEPRIDEADGVVTLSGSFEAGGEWRELLREWLKRKGREYLGPWLSELSEEFGLPYSRVQVRLQKSRWGSRSGRGTLSLNARLLFLPPALARYVLLHELAHGRHLDHSAKFWALVYSMEPQCHELDRRLTRMAGKHVPPWAG